MQKLARLCLRALAEEIELTAKFVVLAIEYFRVGETRNTRGRAGLARNTRGRAGLATTTVSGHRCSSF